MGLGLGNGELMHYLPFLAIIMTVPVASYGQTYVNSTTFEAEAGSGAGGSFSFSSGANRIAIVGRCIRENGGAVAADTAAPTVGGSSTTQIGSGISNSGGVMRGELYYLKNPSSGSQTIATFPAASSDRNMTVVAEYTGVDQTAPVRAETTLSLASTALNLDAIASAVGDLVIANFCIRSQNPHTTIAPEGTAPTSTERQDVGHTNVASTLKIALYEEAGAATSTNIRAVLDLANQTASIGVALKPVAVTIVRPRGVVIFP